MDIDPDDTVGSLYFDKLFPLGVEAMVEAVILVRDGAAPRAAQDESQATYEGWCKAEDIVIDWSGPAAEVYNLIRGGDPSPGAGSTFEGKKIRFYRARKGDQTTGGRPGQVTEVSEDAFGVAAVGGTIFVQRVQPEGSRKVMASEWIESVGLRPGARFGAP